MFVDDRQESSCFIHPFTYLFAEPCQSTQMLTMWEFCQLSEFFDIHWTTWKFLLSRPRTYDTGCRLRWLELLSSICSTSDVLAGIKHRWVVLQSCSGWSERVEMKDSSVPVACRVETWPEKREIVSWEITKIFHPTFTQLELTVCQYTLTLQ